ncbi:hypothetical protein [Neptunomonas phycophila]|uniref:hypothetical protein n=1 Tax=Neptunomonas phycophila TaxID=1572645 RepID=UPI003517AA72
MKKLLYPVMLMLSFKAYSLEYVSQIDLCASLVGNSSAEQEFYKQFLDGFIVALSGDVSEKKKNEFFSDVWNLCKTEGDITVRSAARAVYMMGDY